ncbi:MAG: glycosyltransferase family 61 protein [Selenomonas ruminantium]|nr:glycosyltransferase family 61 protein [Selenomonas ruminantium]
MIDSLRGAGVMKDEKRLYVRRKDDWERACCKTWLSDHPLHVRKVTAGILLPPDNWNPQTGEYQGGVCDRQRSFVAGMFRHKPPQAGFYGVSSAYPVKGNIVYEDKDVIFGGILIGHFGHFLLECLGRLWYVMERDEPHKPLVFLTELDVCPWFWDFFALLGIARERIILVGKPTQFKSVIVPEESVHSWYSYTQKYLLPYRYIAAQAQKLTGNKSLGKKLFLTRIRLAKSQTKCINEEYFCQFFARQGFAMVELESFPLAEQIAIVNNAEEIVSIMGSLTHWALFCRPGTKFTMLTRTSADVLDSQCLVNEASQVDWYIVDTAMNMFYASRSVGVCLIGPTIFWQEYVRDHYNIRQKDDSWKNSYHEYMREWTDFMLQYQYYQDAIKKLDPLELIIRINRALHQNEMVLPQEEEACRMSFMGGDEEKAYYWDEGINSLICLSLDTGANSVCYHSQIREYPAPLYGMPVKSGRYLVLPPENADAVLRYDIESGKASAFPVPEHLPRGNFRYAVSYGDWVIMTGVRYAGIIAFKPHTGEIRLLLKLNGDELEACDKGQPLIFGKPCILADMLYVPICDTNQVLELNLVQSDYRIHQVGGEEAYYGFAAVYAGNIWLAPSQGGPMRVWNPPTGITRIFDGYPAEVKFTKVAGKICFFTDILVHGASLWLLPWGADRIMWLNMESGLIESVPIQFKAQKPTVSCGCIVGSKMVIKTGSEIIIYDI